MSRGNKGEPAKEEGKEAPKDGKEGHGGHKAHDRHVSHGTNLTTEVKSHFATKDGKHKANVPNGQSNQPQQANPNNTGNFLAYKSLPTTCPIHKAEFSAFCESCDELICSTCYILGPHNNKMMHKVNGIPESFMSRSLVINQRVSAALMPKCDQLVLQRQKLDYRMNEIKGYSGLIERDANSDYMGILDRLRSAEGQKQAVLANDMAVLQRDVENITEVNQHVIELTKPGSSHLEFLYHYRVIHERVEFLAAKGYKTSVDVYPFDLPRETKERREVLQKAECHQAQADLRDKISQKLGAELDIINENYQKYLENQVLEDISGWSSLIDKFQKKLSSQAMNCYYCGVTMDPQSVNEDCHGNSDREPQSNSGFTSQVPDESFNGSGRHYFAKPGPVIVKVAKEKELQRSAERKRRNVVGDYKIVLEVLVEKVRRICQEKGIDLWGQFKEYDKAGTGYVSGFLFERVLVEKFGAALEEVEQVVSVIDPLQHGEISYKEFFNMYSDPDYFNKMN